jgi:hypothetical protein
MSVMVYFPERGVWQDMRTTPPAGQHKEKIDCGGKVPQGT